MKYLIYSLISVLGVFFSCQDMEDMHSQYIKDGETKYTNKADSLQSFAGNKRVLISGFISGAFNVNEIVVTWDKGNKTKTFPYSKSDNHTDTLKLYITELEEKSYEFKVYSKDADDNESVPVTVFGSAYGENYMSNLEARSVNGVSFDGADGEIQFAISGDEFQRKTEVKYTNINDEEVIVTIEEDESAIALPNASPSNPIMYRTFYVPTLADEDGSETSIDLFPSNWNTYEFPSTITSVFASLSLDPISGGVIANWENSENTLLTFDFINSDKNGGEVTNTMMSSDPEGTYTVTGMKSEEQEIKIAISDTSGNSQSISFTVTPLPAAGKGSWTIVDFSTEEPAEGAPNGLASAAIDGDLSTFWHTQWNGGSPGYPHYIAFDMGAEKTIAGFEVFRRQGDGRGQTRHKFYVSLDGTNWTDLGEYDMDPNTNDGQVYMVTPVLARYVKYEATEGSNFFAFLAEINVIESLDNIDWSVTDFSSEMGNAPASNTIDGELGTFWHSEWSPNQPPYPHYFTVDLGVEKTVAGFEVFRRQGDGRGQIKHKFYVSLDGINWTDLGEYNMDATTDAGQFYEVALTKARYVKYEATEGPNFYCFLAEINVYGLID
ncbi:DUF4998 domain-containing protein [Snuella sedimenti]|nr:DUF4998 domain-containing protein [Snuella sedimenti]